MNAPLPRRHWRHMWPPRGKAGCEQCEALEKLKQAALTGGDSVVLNGVYGRMQAHVQISHPDDGWKTPLIPGRDGRKLVCLPRVEVTAKYESGVSVETLHQQYGVSRESVRRLLFDTWGVKRRTPYEVAASQRKYGRKTP